MSIIYQWAIDYQVPAHAVQDLQRRLGLIEDPSLVALLKPKGAKDEEDKGTESWVQSHLRLKAVEENHRLFRNNSGVLLNDRGTPVRFGLHNISKAVNKVFKSGDLIGIYRFVIQPQHVGLVVGQFWSVEVKPEGWILTGKGREEGQLNWANMINSLGGRAQFSTGSL